MDAIEFVNRYESNLDEIRSVIRPELFPQLDELSCLDLQDLITLKAWFSNGDAARGMVWAMFVTRVTKMLSINKSRR